MGGLNVLAMGLRGRTIAYNLWIPLPPIFFHCLESFLIEIGSRKKLKLLAANGFPERWQIRASRTDAAWVSGSC